MSLEAIIPHMTSNNAPAPFIASTSNHLASFAPFNAFQDNGGAWISDVAYSYIKIDLGRPYKLSKVFIDTVSSLTGAKMRTLTLQASKNGTDWTDLYVGATTNYQYTEEKDFGTYRYCRIRAGEMTSRGACVRYFQLYSSSLGLADIEIKNIWVSSAPVVLKGSIYATSEPLDVRVLINDTVADDWYTFTGVTPVEYEYDDSLFTHGGNIIKVQTRNLIGEISEELFVAYKLDLSIYRLQMSSYDFKIKNSPLRPSQDPWVGQSYLMDYLNSEHGISYVFRFKPYAQIDSRIEDSPRLFDRILKESFNVEPQLMGVKTFNENAIKQESKLGEVNRILNAIKSQAVLGFKEIGIIQRVFDAWASMNVEDIGIKQDVTELAIKKMKVSQDILKNHKLNAKRKEMIQNALTLIQGYEFSTRKVFDTVIAYYRAMDEFYPYKETIIGGLLINARGAENIATMLSTRPLGDVRENSSVVYPLSLSAVKEEFKGIHQEDVWSERIGKNDSITGELLYGINIPRNSKIHGSDTLYSDKNELVGISQEVTFAMINDKEGITYDTLLSVKDTGKDSFNADIIRGQKNDRSKDVRLSDQVFVEKNQRSKEFRIDGVKFVDDLPVEAYVEQLYGFTELLPVSSHYKSEPVFVSKMEDQSYIVRSLTNVGLQGIDALIGEDKTVFFNALEADALLHEDRTQYVDKMGKSSFDFMLYTIVDKMSVDSWLLENVEMLFNKLSKDSWEDKNSLLIERSGTSREASPILETMFYDKDGRNVRPILLDSYVEKIEDESHNYGNEIRYIDKGLHKVLLDETLRSIDKIGKEASVWTVLTNVNAIEKATMIYEHWDFAMKIIPEMRVIDDSIRFGDKNEKHMDFYEDTRGDVENHQGLVFDQLLMESSKLNGYIVDLIGAEIEQDMQGIKAREVLSDREKALAFIQKGIESNRVNQEKEGYIPENTFVLAGDGSEWEEIWDRYSPGVDILDPPDTDYDYSKLAPAIYDLSTGVPKHPIGPSNKPDVYVQTATSHPIPENSTVGVDDTKRIAVDNYIFIDCVLALESIKNRQKLRYAGMPVGKTIKEVFSQLYTWIQQAAPGHKEYERMFRFARWYAEAVVLRSSKQILHRVYNPWQSSLHAGSGLGIDHVKPGWTYMTGTGTLDTTALSAHLIFSKENYIDSEFVLRGYFDNPAGQGTMEISIDGVVVDSFQTHGIYERKIEILQGHHSYNIFFHGVSGTASISSIEIGGTNFVSAHTTSDDSDVNGLKALTELMAQLLGYFELHHGGRKIKGTMEVRQRAVWNTHT